jgi:hypothetical protein
MNRLNGWNHFCRRLIVLIGLSFVLACQQKASNKPPALPVDTTVVDDDTLQINDWRSPAAPDSAR